MYTYIHVFVCIYISKDLSHNTYLYIYKSLNISMCKYVYMYVYVWSFERPAFSAPMFHKICNVSVMWGTKYLQSFAACSPQIHQAPMLSRRWTWLSHESQCSKQANTYKHLLLFLFFVHGFSEPKFLRRIPFPKQLLPKSSLSSCG